MSPPPPNRRATQRLAVAGILLLGVLVVQAHAQTSSIERRHDAKPTTSAKKSTGDPRHPAVKRGNPTLEKHSLSAVKIKPPRKFQVHDLITIIVREQRKFEADGGLETKRRFDVKAKLEDIFKPIDGTLGAGTFKNGKPGVDFKLNNRLKYESDKDREDRFTTRLTAEVVDIKPNGNLVVQGSAETHFDDEEAIVTLTGIVRSSDVTPDNTILSTQLAGKVIDLQNKGAVRDGNRRGWIPRLIDSLRPF